MIASQVPDQPAPRAPLAGVIALDLGMVAIAAVGLWALPGDWVALAPSGWTPWWVIAALTAAGELMAIHVESRRSAHTITVKELPLVVGLAVLSPLVFLASQLIGTAVGLLLDRRQNLRKLVFNLAKTALETVIAIAVYHEVVGRSGVTSLRGLVGALLVVLVVDLVASLAVTAVLWVHDGELDSSVLRDALGQGLALTLVNASMAFVVLVLLDTRPAAIPLVLIFYGVLYLAYLSLGRMSAARARVETLYGFTRAAPRPDGQATETLLRELRVALRARATAMLALERIGEAANWWVVADDLSSVGDEVGPRGTWWTPALTGRPVLSSGTDEEAADAMAVPVYRDHSIVAVLFAADRDSAVADFGTADLELFTALAGHAGVTLENSDLVRRLRAEVAEKEHRGAHDPLTGLPNRVAFQDHLDRLLTDPPSGGVAVVVIDLDRFQDINDAVGHSVGDAVLRTVATRLRRIAREAGLLARLGSDEFAFLAGVGPPGYDDSWTTMTAAVREALREPVVVGDVSLEVCATMGVAVSPEHGRNARSLMQHAEIAMHRAKAGPTFVEVYSLVDGEASRRRLVLAADLRAALASDEVEVWYQPQARSLDRTVTGVEALVRWRHPELGRIAPEEIVATAERTGLIAELSAHVIENSLRTLAEWDRQGMLLEASVNLEVRDLLNERLPRTVALALARHQVPAHRLTLEITESSIMVELDRSLQVLHALAAMGVRLSVDDFGTGQSSLTYLTRLPVHELKIDKSFVIGEHGVRDDIVVRSAVDLAHELGLRVVAEGVEDDAAWLRVLGLGCELVQGYGLARPTTAAEVSAWLVGQRVAPPALQGRPPPGSG